MTDEDAVSRLLMAERIEAPPIGVAAAGRARLLSAVAAQVAPLPVAAGATKLGWPLVAKWVGAGFAVGLAGAGVAAYGTAPRVQTPPATVSAPQTASSSRTPEPPVAPEAPVEPQPEKAPELRRLPSVSRSAAAAPSSLGPSFDEELRLLTGAKRELAQNRPHLARAWLHEHRARFMTGVFSVDREGLLVQASCLERAQPELARAFAARYPQSAMVGPLLRSCGAAERPMPSQLDFPERDK